MSCMASNTGTGLFRFGGFYRWLVITALVMLAVYAMTGAASVAAITREEAFGIGSEGINVVVFTHNFNRGVGYTPISGMASFWMFSISALPSTLVTFFVIVNILFLHRAQYFYTALILETVSLIAYFVAPIVITVTTLDHKLVDGMKQTCKKEISEECSTFTSKQNTILALLWVFSLLGLALRAFYIFVLFKAFRAQALNDGQSLRSTDTTTNLSILPTASNAGIKGILHRLGSYRWLVITALIMLVVHAMTGSASLAAITRQLETGAHGSSWTTNVVYFTRYYKSTNTYGLVAGMDCFWVFSLSAVPSVLVTLFALVNIIFLQRALFYLTVLTLESVSLLIYFISPIVVTIMTKKHSLYTSNRDKCDLAPSNGYRLVSFEVCDAFNSAMTTIFALLWTFWILGLVLRIFYIYQLFVAYRNRKNRQPRL